MTSSLCAAALALAGLFSLPTLAESCYVTADSATAGPTSARSESCYEHTEMPPGSLDWTCNDSTKDVLHTHAEKRPNCPAGYSGKCTAPLTQETLANEAAFGRYGKEAVTLPTVPEKAKIVTYYYQVKDKAQTKIDCEKAGGQWSN